MCETRTIRLLSVVGARPQFVKLGPVSREIRRLRTVANLDLEDFIVHTGQHYDPAMSAVFFAELDIPSPAVNLSVGSGSHGAQTGRMLAELERVMIEAQPDVVVVYGDTNSTAAGALAAAKLHLPVLHVESGLRSFNRFMPEEINRIVADHVSSRLAAPTATAVRNLEREGLAARTVLTGDVMLDAVQHHAASAIATSQVLQRLGIEPGSFLLATIHRAENTTGPVLQRLLQGLEAAAHDWLPIIFPMHPRTVEVIGRELPGWAPSARLRIIEPQGYLDMLRLVGGARCVLTDSGGLQKEAAFLGTPCITLRDETEWVETLEHGANRIAGSDGRDLSKCVEHWMHMGSDERQMAMLATAKEFGGGSAASRILQEAVDLLSGTTSVQK